MSGLHISYFSYPLILRHSFNIAHGKRSSTPAVFLKLIYKNYVVYGEASLPPYLKENPESVISYFEKVKWDLFDENNPLLFIDYLNQQAEANLPALAAIDMAIFDLAAKINFIACHDLLSIQPKTSPLLSYTISYDDEEKILEKINDSNKFNQLKIKLGTGNDKAFIDFVLLHSNKAFFVDANQGWKTKKEARYMCEFLKERNCMFIEQAFPVEMEEEQLWLKAKNILPQFADESISTLNDLMKKHTLFDGINIKLMKCGGIKNALKMIAFARNKNLKLMMGCMTETSCGIAAASQIAPLCDYADLDGSHLISNNPFAEIMLTEGRILLQKKSGIGIERTQFPIPEGF
jgi:L-Ala-D/L-Glu epimerase